MFEALRWRLTAWYVLVFAIVFAVVGLIVFVSADHRSSTDVHDAVREVSEAARTEVVRTGEISASDADVRAVLARASLSGSADVFVLLLRPDGTIASNPSDVPTEGLPDAASLDRARLRGSDVGRYDIRSLDLEVRTVAVYDRSGQLLGFVQAGKSLEERDASLRTLVIVIVVGGVTGLFLAAAGGLFVAGIAMRPVRRSFERQREFVADASHELRTPLAVIRVNAESAAISGSAKEAVSDIAAETTYMTRLLDDLLVLAGNDQDGVALQISHFDLADIVADTARGATSLAYEAGIRFTFTPGSSLAVDADPERCHEVLLALVDNAIKYTPSGGSIELSTRAEAGEAVVEVSDTGIGVPAEEVGRLFDRFYRVDKARSRASGGAGLGLSIAREIVDAHHGSLTIESELAVGTTVTLRLPLAGTTPHG